MRYFDIRCAAGSKDTTQYIKISSQTLSSWDSECSVKKGLHTFVHVNDKAWGQDWYSVRAHEKYGPPERAIAEMNDPKQNPSAGLAICLSSCTKPTPYDRAKEINEKLLASDSILHVKKVGTFVVDFASETLIRKIYIRNF